MALKGKQKNIDANKDGRISEIDFKILRSRQHGGMKKKMGKATLQASEISGKLVTLLSDIFKASKIIRVYQKEDDEKK